MDQSRRTRLIRQAYGGSDNTRPGFSWPEYVRHASSTDPKDLGTLDNRRLVHEGFIGAEGGGQTLFFMFRLERRARVSLRLTSDNTYTIQYISASVRGPGGDAIDLPVGQQEVPQQISVVTFYVEPLYWDEGYVRVEVQSGTSPADQGQQGGTGATVPTPTSDFNPINPGVYIVAVSSSQWPRLSYRLEIVSSIDTPLSAVCDLTANLAGRMGFTNLSAIADIEADAEATATRQAALAAAAGFSVNPVGGVFRRSVNS